MSDDPTGADGTAEAAVATNAVSGSGSRRLVILLLILGAALACLLYDYAVARPAQRTAYEAMVGLLEGTNPDPDGDGTVTDAEVHAILGHKPAKIEHLSNGKIEIFSWRSGLPYRTYELFVVYSGKRLPLLHYASTQRPEKSDLPPEPAVYQPPTQEELDNFVPPNPGLGESVGMPGVQKGRRKGAGKDPTPPQEAAGGEAPSVQESTDDQDQPPQATEREDSSSDTSAGEEPQS